MLGQTRATSSKRWFSRSAYVCALAASFLLTSFPAFSATSPEFYQLLLEVNGQLKTFVPKRGPQCTPDLVDKAQNALQRELAVSALNAVVVKPLETGAKTALGLLGVPAAAISTYSVMRCAMDESSPEGFAKCALGEAIGYGAGKGLEAAQVDEISGALAGVSLGEAYNAARGAYDSYQSTSETVEGEASGECKVKYRFHWRKRRSGSARGGRIMVQMWISDCECTSPSEARSGYVTASFNVNYAKAGSDQPGWRVAAVRAAAR